MKKEVVENKKIYFSPGNLKWKNKYLGFVNQKQIWTVFSKNLDYWYFEKTPVLSLRKGYFDAKQLNILDVLSIKQGILLLYFINKPFCIGGAILSKKNPKKVLWRSAQPIFKSNKNIIPINTKIKNNEIKIRIKYKNKNGVINFCLNNLISNLFKKEFKIIKLEKNNNNPILSPDNKYCWENKAIFNPAAIYLNNKIHFIYRAIGNSNISTFGYASSKDGIHIDKKSSKPVFSVRRSFEKKQKQVFSYASGGSWDGCEDPRLVSLGNKVYLIYTYFNGYFPPRIALTSIDKNKFLNKNWDWEKSVFLSPPGKINKNWVIFPEKINSKYAILHSISPEILIDYFDNLSFDGHTFINSFYSRGDRKNSWDNYVRGVGPPPIKTKDGWLVLYHAMEKKDPGRYKIGAMILDFNNPKNILYRSNFPILEPNETYENNGIKPGVVYCCGAVVKDDTLFVYYGGSDMVSCVATANLNNFLESIKNSQLPTLKIK